MSMQVLPTEPSPTTTILTDIGSYCIYEQFNIMVYFLLIGIIISNMTLG